MKRLLDFSLIVSMIILLLFFGCDKKSTKSDDINCNDLSIQNNAPSYPFNCSGTYSASITNIQYDQYGRKTSYNFDISCSSHNETLTGRYYNMTYNSIAQLQTFEATINGKHCSYP